MKSKAIGLIAVLLMLFGCKKSDNTYHKYYEDDGCEYDYTIVYPDGIDFVTAERYASFDIANDHHSIVELMDSLINAGTSLDFWCNDYYRAMKETMPYDSILPRLLHLQECEPSNPSVYSLIGYTYNHLGDTLKSFESFRRGLDLAPENSKLWYGMGLVASQNADTIFAISCFKHSLDLAKKQNFESQIKLSQYMVESLEEKYDVSAN